MFQYKKLSAIERSMKEVAKGKIFQASSGKDLINKSLN